MLQRKSTFAIGAVKTSDAERKRGKKKGSLTKSVCLNVLNEQQHKVASIEWGTVELREKKKTLTTRDCGSTVTRKNMRTSKSKGGKSHHTGQNSAAVNPALGVLSDLGTKQAGGRELENTG